MQYKTDKKCLALGFLAAFLTLLALTVLYAPSTWADDLPAQSIER